MRNRIRRKTERKNQRGRRRKRYQRILKRRANYCESRGARDGQKRFNPNEKLRVGESRAENELQEYKRKRENKKVRKTRKRI